MYFWIICRFNLTHLPSPFRWRWRSSQGTCRIVTSCRWWRYERYRTPRPADSPAESYPPSSCLAPDQIVKIMVRGLFSIFLQSGSNYFWVWIHNWSFTKCEVHKRSDCTITFTTILWFCCLWSQIWGGLKIKVTIIFSEETVDCRK